jgi:hypothetical protein
LSIEWIKPGSAGVPTFRRRSLGIMGSLKKRRKAKINKHKRRKQLRANRHKKRTWQK